MATVTTTALIDDLDGTTTDVGTVSFTIDGYHYLIDLTGANKEKLYAALEPFMVAGRQTREANSKPKAVRNGRQPARTDPAQLAAVRAWAAQNGHAVKPRGRVPGKVMAAYEAAHQEATA
jgi:hypothetical protein